MKTNPIPCITICSSTRRWVGAAVLAFMSLATVVNAATRTWSGAGSDANWSTPANWGGTAPVTGDALTFSGTTTQTNTNDISGLGLGLLTFSTAGWNISGQALTITNITANVAGTINWDLNTTINTLQTLNQNNSGGILKLNGEISGPGGFQKTAGGNGRGQLYLSNTNNSFTGALNLFSGTTYIYSLANKGTNSSLGAGTTTINVGSDSSAFVGNLVYLGEAPSTTDRFFNWRYNPTTPGNVMRLLNNSPALGGLTFNATWAVTPGNAGVPWTLHLGGSSAATNVVNANINMAGSNPTLPVSLSVNGPGTWVFTKQNNMYGPLVVTSNGVCVLQSTATLINPSGITVQPGSLLDVTSFDTNGIPFSLGFYTPQTLTAGRTGSPATDIAGSLKLEFPSTVSGGTLDVAGTGVAGTVSLSSNFIPAFGIIAMDLDSTTTVGSDVNDLVLVGGDLDLSQGQATIRVKPLDGVVTTNVPYTLIAYTGSLIGDASGLTVPSPGRAYSAGVVSAGSGLVTVTFQSSGVPAANLVWQGDGGLNQWDTGLSLNWLNGGTPDYFFTADNVTFDDSSANTTVYLDGGLNPTLATVNSTNTYTFTTFSGGSLSSGSLLKRGSGTLDLQTPNAFSGGTVLSAGTLVAGTNNAPGSGLITVGDAASGSSARRLVLDNGAQLNNAMVITSNGTGTVTLERGAGAGNCGFAGLITLERDVTFQSANPNQNGFVFSGGVTGTGNVTITGGGVTRWQPSDASFLGTMFLTGTGTHFDCNATLSTNLNLEIGAGTEFGCVTSPTINALNGAGSVVPGLGTSTFNPTLSVGAAGGSGTFAGRFSTNSLGRYCNLVKLGDGTQILTGDNSLSGGNTTVGGGTLVVNNTTGSGLCTGNVDVQAGATLAGNGTVVSSATATLALSGSLSVGNAGDTTGATFTLSNNGMTVNAGGTLAVDLFAGAGAGDNSGTPAAADVFNAQTTNVTLTAGAVLNVGNPNGLTGWAIGDKWKVINWATAPTGTFTVNGPALPPGLAWDDSELYTTGVLAVVAAAATDPGELTFAFSASALTLSWTNTSAVLQAAPEVTGVYTNVPGATSPFVITNFSQPREFFRLATP